MSDHDKHIDDPPTTRHLGSGGDEAPELHPSRRPGTKRRTPRSLLLFTIALTVVLIGGMIAVLNSKPGGEPDSTSPVHGVTGAETGETTGADPTTTALARRVEELAAQLALHNEEANRRIDEQGERLRALEEKLAGLAPSERVDALEASAKQARDELAKRITDIERSVKRLRAPAKRRTSKTSTPTLPFKLVSVDLWDGVPYAALSQDERVELVRAGQFRSGWTVEHIDYRSGKVVFRDSHGHTIEQTAGR